MEIDAQDGEGWTALYHAVCDSNDAMTRLLIKAGARKDLYAKDGSTVVTYAHDAGIEDIAELLE